MRTTKDKAKEERKCKTEKALIYISTKMFFALDLRSIGTQLTKKKITWLKNNTNNYSSLLCQVLLTRFVFGSLSEKRGKYLFCLLFLLIFYFVIYKNILKNFFNFESCEEIHKFIPKQLPTIKNPVSSYKASGLIFSSIISQCEGNYKNSQNAVAVEIQRKLAMLFFWSLLSCRKMNFQSWISFRCD